MGLQNLPVDTEVSGFDTANLGYDFGALGQCDKKLTAESSCWYPMAGYLYYDYDEESKKDVVFSGVGSYGRNWSRTPYIGSFLYLLTAFYRNDTSVSTSKSYRGASAYSVRCLKENK